MRAFNLLFLASISVQALSAPLSGIPVEISGQGKEKVDAVGDVDRGMKSGVQYAREAVAKDFSLVRPAKDNSMSNPESGSAVVVRPQTPNQETNALPKFESPRVNVVPPVFQQAPVEAPLMLQSTAPAAQLPPQVGRSEVEFDIPDGYTVVKKDSLGRAVINGDKSGTYIVKAPALLFSKVILPFSADYETPFPDQVVIQKKNEVFLIAPKGSVLPINIVFYHPEKPSLSVSILFLPLANEIPASIDIKFDPAALPQSKSDVARTGEQIGPYRVSTLQERDSMAASRYERASTHVEIIKKLNVDLSSAKIPDGYQLKVITDGPSGVLCGDRRLVGKYSQNLLGEQFEVDVFNVRNMSDDYVTFSERGCYRSGVASVQFNPTSTLKPGQDAELIIIHSKAPAQPSNQNVRPSLVGGAR